MLAAMVALTMAVAAEQVDIAGLEETEDGLQIMEHPALVELRVAAAEVGMLAPVLPLPIQKLGLELHRQQARVGAALASLAPDQMVLAVLLVRLIPQPMM
jgi:hypothetical protein